MSDPTVEDDSLISQDDIDKLLASSSVEEAEDKLSLDEDELGELSQDDIDSLLNSNIEDVSEDISEFDEAEDDMELISQDDIDSLMDSALDDDDSATDESVADDFGELSQDDIDNLMSGADEDDAPSDEPDDDAFGELSQDDIDSLMSGAGDDDLPGDSGEEYEEMISQDDIKNLMSSEAATQEDQDTVVQSADSPVESTDDSEDAITSVPIEEDVVAEEDTSEIIADTTLDETEVSESDHADWVIKDSAAVAAEACVITQETLDDLVANFDPTPDLEPVSLDESESVLEESVDIPMLSEGDEDEDQIVELDADLDEALASEAEPEEPQDDDVTVLDFDDEEDVTQEDIDALLLDTDGEDEEDDDILISQDDIDTLLMAADEEEDVLGDLMDSDSETDLDGDFDDEDILDPDLDDDEYDDEDQVVLEGDDEPLEKKSKKTKKALLAKGWYRSKLVIACASAIVVLGITVPIAYFLFFSADSPPESVLPGGQPVANTPAPGMISTPQMPAGVETVEITVEQAPPIVSGNMILNDFVVLAPVEAKEVSYVAADISIDYSDQRAYHEIQNNLSFYRDLIYDSIEKKLLVAKDQQEVTEADILLSIETALKKILPGDYIERVSFKSFKIS